MTTTIPTAPTQTSSKAPIADFDLRPGRARARSLDILRGAVMVLMAIDHVRVYFAAEPLRGLDSISAGLFLTRWITHFCAPVFIFLAGAGAFLHGRKLGSMPALSRYLLTRGLGLVVLELTVMRLGWTFNLAYDEYLLGGVIWVIGWCFVVMAAAVRLPRAAILIIGLAIVLGHNVLDPFAPAIRQSLTGTDSAWIFQILYLGGPIRLGGDGGPVLAVLYTIVPWIGVMLAGYGFGAIVELSPARRRALCFGLGGAAIGVFLLLRGFNLYGDPRDWSPVDRSPWFTLFSFVNTAKYPASLLFLLMTLGPALALVPVLEHARGRLAAAIEVFGRVPLFYYVLHIPLIHGLAVALAWARQGTVDPWLFANHPMMVPPTPDGLGYGVPVLYVVWAGVVVALYFPCRWYAERRRRARDARATADAVRL